MKVVYKCKKTGTVSSSVDMSDFIGYKIQVDHGRISKVFEYQKGIVLATISYRPTKTPLIERIEYNGHVENRYNNNRVSTVYFQHDSQFYGEHKRYDTQGELISRMYFYENRDITEEVMKFVGYTGDPNQFKYYSFQEDEMFNLMLKYGVYFRFCFESDRESTEFDKITEYCNKI